MIAFCKASRQIAPVDLYNTGAMGHAGSDSDVIMAAGAFVQDLYRRLSADGPIKPHTPYISGQHLRLNKVGIPMSLEYLVRDES